MHGRHGAAEAGARATAMGPARWWWSALLASTAFAAASPESAAPWWYPTDRVNLTDAVHDDVEDGKRRFMVSTRLLQAARKPGHGDLAAGSSAQMGFVFGAAHFRLCEDQARMCRMGTVDSLAIMTQAFGGVEGKCTAKGLHIAARRYLARSDIDPDERAYMQHALNVGADFMRKHEVTADTPLNPHSCTPEGELALTNNCVESLQERFLPQRELFSRLRARSPGALALRETDRFDLAFAEPSAAWGKMGFDYAADRGVHLLSAKLDAAANAALALEHEPTRDVLEVAHSCLPVDGGVARSRRAASGPPDGFFCAWRRQHDLNPAGVEVYTGWLDGDFRPASEPVRLTPGDDPRLFTHGGRVLAVYNDAWVGDPAGELTAAYPAHNTRVRPRVGGPVATICVWLAAFRVPADEGALGAEGGAAALRALGPRVMSGRAQLVPPPEVRAPASFAESDGPFPFGKNWIPFSHGGDLHFIYSLSPLLLLRCDDLSPLALDPMLEPAGAIDPEAYSFDAAKGRGAGGRPTRVIECGWSPLQPDRASLDPRAMGGLRGSTPAHVLPGGYVFGLGHLRFNHMVATPFAFRLALGRLDDEADDARGLEIAFPDPDAFAAPVAWKGSSLPAREANPVNLFFEADGTARLLISLKRGTDFMVGSSQEHTFQTSLVNVSTALAAPPTTSDDVRAGAAGKDEL